MRAGAREWSNVPQPHRISSTQEKALPNGTAFTTDGAGFIGVNATEAFIRDGITHVPARRALHDPIVI